MKRPLAFFDMEVYPNFALCAFMKEDGERMFCRAVDANQPVGELDDLRAFVKSHTLITFNGTGYDIPLLMLVLRKEPVSVIKKASDRIILQNLKWWGFEKEFHVNCKHPDLDHIDIMEVAPLSGGLKLYAGKNHSFSIQDLPVDPTKPLSPDEIDAVTTYCFNDLLSTRDLYNRLKVAISMREAMSKRYGIDLRSKSDAQMAEAIIASEVEKSKKVKLKKPGDMTGQSFKYKIPEWMEFWEIDILSDIINAQFMINDKGGIILPDEIKNKKIKHKGGVYRMGIGGLHSSESVQQKHADDRLMIMDFDVASYYPAIVLNQKLYPQHIGPEFLMVYRALVNKRLEAKKRVGELKALIKASPDQQAVLEEELKKIEPIMEGLKISINGTFGKLGSKWSVLYAPDLMIQVTITGQLALLMLIETLSALGSTTVISANTDGVMVQCDRAVEPAVLSAVELWEKTTGFTTERTDYQSVYSRDVNNYVAIKTDGSVKTKGTYGKGLPLHKNPANEICGDALVNYLTIDADIEASIKTCDDIRKFLTVRTVKGGAKFRGQAIGKVARWYYAKENTDDIRYVSNDYLVPKSEGAMPCVQLPPAVPLDLDYEWYITETKSMLADLGVQV